MPWEVPRQGASMSCVASTGSLQCPLTSAPIKATLPKAAVPKRKDVFVLLNDLACRSSRKRYKASGEGKPEGRARGSLWHPLGVITRQPLILSLLLQTRGFPPSSMFFLDFLNLSSRILLLPYHLLTNNVDS